MQKGGRKDMTLIYSRKANINDIDSIMPIIDDAKAFLKLVARSGKADILISKLSLKT